MSDSSHLIWECFLLATEFDSGQAATLRDALVFHLIACASRAL